MVSFPPLLCACPRPALERKLWNVISEGPCPTRTRPLTHQISPGCTMQRGNYSIRHLLLFSRPLPVHCRSNLPPSCRHLSSDLPYAVIHTAERFFEGVHLHTHLPWWAVIACCTVALRSLITLPLAVHQNKMLAKMELLIPTLKEYQEAVQHNVITKCRRENVPYEIASKREKKAVCKIYLVFFQNVIQL